MPGQRTAIAYKTTLELRTLIDLVVSYILSFLLFTYSRDQRKEIVFALPDSVSNLAC